MLSKVLQSIANGVLPGKKEGYMETMNEFIASHIKEATAFFERISTVPPESRIDFERYPVPERAYENALIIVYKHINTCKSKIDTVLDGKPNGDELKSRLNNVLSD